jgi:ABC-type amino acid transport substrate-binding protein
VPSKPSPRDTAGRRRLRADLTAIATIAALLVAVNFLPPDRTLAEVRASGVLRACVPVTYPPLVTGTPGSPGIDIEILQHVADELGVRLLLVPNSAIGRDFDPRNWRLSRAQCVVIGGGVVDTQSTRGYLVVTPPHLETGWAAAVHAARPDTLRGARVGFYAGLTGLDRLALGRWLRDQGAEVTIVAQRDEAREGLENGRFDVVVSEALTARFIAGEVGGSAVWLPLTSGRVPIGFGTWKGDLTLERAMRRALRAIEGDGRRADILLRYELAPITDDCTFCS